ncbi:MAG: adenylyltransferase [Deltaproteobacteria bacterium RIFCSPLOWO2_02_FULL_57_26]|nr:MAG: adenylyltransferase [Deltaproteobacteria bacterium RIFCSPLOWO2_02_FULL_57_26]OGQ74509.1 MAG: adenylyltransferase [Deltaproteobacteria bacterium RIFCSPLOWO2_12_FULL_57_22]
MTLRLTPEQIERYSRQIMIPDVGGKGQIRVRQGRVLVIGAGGLGSPAAFYLAAAGIGTLGLVDYDRVELSNLQRQILHFTEDVGRQKVASAEEKLNRLNPEVEIRTLAVRLEERNATEILAAYDFIVDGSDNFATKFLVNDAAVALGKPFSHAGIVRLQGQTMTVIPGKSACYRCLFKGPPPPGEILSCQQAGILGAVAGTIGSIQATEAIKFFAGMEDDLLTDRLLIYDAKTLSFRTIEVQRDLGCAACGRKKGIKSTTAESSVEAGKPGS